VSILALFDLNINSRDVRENIIHSIKKTMQERETNGLLVIFSGQNDSFAATKLAIEAAGLDFVKLLIISDVSKNRRNEIISIANRLLDFSKDRIISFDIKNISNQFYSISELISTVTKGIPTVRQHNINSLLLRTKLVQKIIEEKTLAHIGKITSRRDEFFYQVIAYSNATKRLKTLLAYLIAEKENLLLISKTNKTEWLTGLYTVFGYGHAADIMPLGDLYRTQVLQLAEILNVPKEIRNLAYTDIIPGISNKFQYFFNLESSDIDKILVRLEADWQPETISKTLDIDLTKIERVEHFYQVSKIEQSIPIIPILKK
jgi:NAD+ synthase